MNRYNVFVEKIAGWVEAPSWGMAVTKAERMFGDQGQLTRVQPVGGTESDERTDRERAKYSARNNDAEQDGS